MTSKQCHFVFMLFENLQKKASVSLLPSVVHESRCHVPQSVKIDVNLKLEGT